MQISNLISQMGINKETKTSNTVSIKGQNVSLASLKAGAVFEGSVVSVKDGQVVIALADGQAFEARLSADVLLEAGTSLFFEVKNNDGAQIAIRPYSQGVSTNPALAEALRQAGAEVTGRNLMMVQNMMEEQLPIDRNSILSMVRTLTEYPNVEPKTLVQMTKFHLPINEADISQFESYKEGRNSIMSGLNDVMEQVADLFENETYRASDLQDLNRQLGEMFGGEKTAAQGQTRSVAEQPEKTMSVVDDGTTTTVRQGESAVEAVRGGQNTAGQAVGENAITGTADGGQNPEGIVNRGEMTARAADDGQNMTETENDGQTTAAGQATPPAETGAAEQSALSPGASDMDAVKEQILHQLSLSYGGEKVTNPLKPISPEAFMQALKENPAAKALTPQERFRIVTDFLDDGSFTKEELSKAMSGKEYRTFLRQAMEDAWLLKPENVAEKNSVKNLYDRLEQHMNKLQQIFSANSGENSPLQKTISDVRSNISFMNELNQIYNYVQIPLKMAGQTAKGDLYVYTNKKALREKKGELTARLHLEFEHLGVTDVYVRLQQNKLTTNFMLESSESFDLVMEHIDELTKRLEEKGYEVSMQVQNEEKKPDFVEDFLRYEQPVGRVYRYSFDVRA